MWRLIFAAAFISFAQAGWADTTYYYSGQPYTHNDDPADLGASMTGSVTFNFDTTGVSGTYNLYYSGAISQLQLTSGIYSVDQSAFYSPVTTFTLSSGEITGWDIPTSMTNPTLPIFSSSSDALGALDMVATGGGPGVVYGAWSHNPGAWTLGPSPAPAPNGLLEGTAPTPSTVPIPGAGLLFLSGAAVIGTVKLAMSRSKSRS